MMDLPPGKRSGGEDKLRLMIPSLLRSDKQPEGTQVDGIACGPFPGHSGGNTKESAMANIHYGNIGDVWKHLPLAEILSMEAPNTYWESHAGSSQYPLTHSAERDYGVFF
jgi:hypothetical protein